ncbi:DUF4189 domain-containing protein [Streptomyces albogriseolus]|uniref:DUF4189 domain-containing protein n=1 Tax=Streptomyces albogriseolus TaxID=1887 RepID=UPI0036B0A8B9
MTSGHPPVVDHATLALGRRLGQGGQGTVHEVTNKKISTSHGGGWDAVYKEYAPAVLPHLDVPALEALSRVTDGLTAAQGRWLCERTAWPAVVVRRQGVACGFLMRAVPDRFMFDLRTLQGNTTAGRRLANMEYLLNDDAYVAGIGLVISERDRLLLLADLADTLSRLHALGITVGDLSPKNLLFTTAPRPECFLIDCDAVRLRGATALPQAETPDWEVPAGEQKSTRGSDAYKLALLAVRMFARDQTSFDPSALASLSPELGRLARAGLGRDPAARPAPAQWAAVLGAASRTASTRPAQGGARSGRSRAGAPPPAGAPTPFRSAGAPPATRPGGGRGVGVAVAVVLAVVALFALEAAQDDSGTGSAATVGESPWPGLGDPSDAYSPDFELPEDEPPEDDPVPEEPTEDDPDVPEVDPPADEDPVEEPDIDPAPAPEPPPPPPPPRPDYYGAIAVNQDGGHGRAWDHPSRAAAEAAALRSCNRTDCRVLTVFVNGCGAVAYNPATNYYHGGDGASEGEATRDAIARAGGGHWITWVCTTR